MPSAPTRLGTALGRVLLVAALSLVLVGATRWWIYTVDDSYISLRYAHHVAIGAGPVFNIGEHVEGYSCPAWVFALASIERLGGFPLLAVQPGVHFYAVSGMETLAFAMAVALAMTIPLWTLPRHALTVASALCLLAVATLRPEGECCSPCSR